MSVLRVNSDIADRLATVSSGDSTPGTLINKLTSTTIAITKLNPGGNEQLSLEVTGGSQKYLLTRFSIIANGTTYIDLTDWRSRAVAYMLFWDPTATPANNQWNYASIEPRKFYVGSNFNNGGADYQFHTIVIGSITANFYIENGSGKIKMTVGGFGGPTTVNTVIVELAASGII